MLLNFGFIDSYCDDALESARLRYNTRLIKRETSAASVRKGATKLYAAVLLAALRRGWSVAS